MSSDKDDQVAGGEASADYMISESGKQQEEAVETTKGKKSSGLSSVTDTIKEKVIDVKDKVVETKDKVTDTTKEKVKDVSSKSDCRENIEAKEPVSPAKVMELHSKCSM